MLNWRIQKIIHRKQFETPCTWLDVISTTPCHVHHSHLSSQILYFHYAMIAFHSAASPFITLSTSVNSVTPTPLPLLLYTTSLIQATKLGVSRKVKPVGYDPAKMDHFSGRTRVPVSMLLDFSTTWVENKSR